MTRIIAGKARGRRLSVPAAGTRPTADRVRESLFSSLDSALAADGIAWSSVSILDLFAGSGALGLEALSRGAAEAVLVEKARPALVVLKRNIEAVGLPGAVVLAKDARALAQDPPQVSAGLVFADPPYDWSAEALAALLNGLGESGWVSPGATVVVERPAKDPLSPLPSSWDQGRRRAYGDTALWYGRLTLPERG